MSARAPNETHVAPPREGVRQLWSAEALRLLVRRPRFYLANVSYGPQIVRDRRREVPVHALGVPLSSEDDAVAATLGIPPAEYRGAGGRPVDPRARSRRAHHGVERPRRAAAGGGRARPPAPSGGRSRGRRRARLHHRDGACGDGGRGHRPPVLDRPARAFSSTRGERSGTRFPPADLRGRWTLRLGDSRSLLPAMAAELAPIDLFVHDAMHTYSAQLREYRAAWPHLCSGAVLVSDDVGNPAFVEFANEWARCRGCSRARTAAAPVGLCESRSDLTCHPAAGANRDRLRLPLPEHGRRAERWYRNLAERLAAEGHEVTYLTLRQWAGRRGAAIPGVAGRRRGAAHALYGARGRRRIAAARFGLGVFWPPAAPRPALRRRPHRVVSLLLAARRRRRASARGASALIVDWHEVWTPRLLARVPGPRRRARRLRACSASACAFRSGRSASRGCTRAACASRACAASVTVLEGEYAGPTRARDAAAGRGRSSSSPAATSRRSACPRSCRRSRRRAREHPRPAGRDPRRRPRRRRCSPADRPRSGSRTSSTLPGFVAPEALDDGAAPARSASCFPPARGLRPRRRRGGRRRHAERRRARARTTRRPSSSRTA